MTNFTKFAAGTLAALTHHRLRPAAPDPEAQGLGEGGGR